ncbi:hypothetical protein RHGRI_023575 [Rhododendron griersonianum]|uniref:GRF-type domain-containing protein n=1 Tax=Rhododendron griersonianum TaxID=479676 RepID=A0AAV6J9G6_9ERIC|nr:hypothetical protein RHGRI_023575 [Rhododendron griersonianum]
MEGSSSKSSNGEFGVFCKCGQEAPLEESRTKKNPGRKFSGCRNYKTSEYCGFFIWYDQYVRQREKNIEGLPSSVVQKSEDSVGRQTNEDNNIDELKKEVKVLKRKMQKMEKQVDELYILNQRRNMGVPSNCTILLFAIVMLVIRWLF